MGRKKNKIHNPPGTHNRQFLLSADRNDAYFEHWYSRLLSLAILRFQWNNLPDSVDERYLELILNTEGSAIFFKDEIVDRFLGLRSANFGRWDIYNIPMQRTAYGSNGYRYQLSNENSVLIYNNVLHESMIATVTIYATRLAEIDRVIDLNMNAQKTPIMIICEESQKQTMQNLYMQYDGNVPFIFGNKNINRDDLNAITTGAPFIAKDAHDLRTDLWNEYLTFLGYSNVSQAKRERMLTDEVIRGMGGSLASRNDGLMMRQQAVDTINRMFGLELEVQFREELPDTMREMLRIDNVSYGESGEGEEE